MTVAVRVIACLDVDRGRVVKGVNFADLRDAGDPVELAALGCKHVSRMSRRGVFAVVAISGTVGSLAEATPAQISGQAHDLCSSQS